MDTVIKQTELSTSSRVVRLVVGSIFIGIVMSSSGQLGYLAVLPLIAIYPILTGIIGEDPLDYLLADWVGGFEGECYSPSNRIALVGLGGVAISGMMLSPESVGIRALLALVSVYPIMAGLFGEDLVSITLGLGGKQERMEESRQKQPVRLVHSTKTAGLTHHYKFGQGAGPKAA